MSARSRITAEVLTAAAERGFSQKRLAAVAGMDEADIRRQIRKTGVSLPHEIDLRHSIDHVKTARAMPRDEGFEYLASIVEMLLPPVADVWKIGGVHLTKYERRLLRRLAAGHGALVSKEALHMAIYGDRPEDEWPDMKLVDIFVCKVRKKVRQMPIVIETIWGAGFRLTVPPGFRWPWEVAQ